MAGGRNILKFDPIGIKRALKCVCWNINGIKSTVVNEKLKTDEFLEAVNDHDIIGLVETHSDGSAIDIPGYHCLHINREKSGKKTYGGIGVFVKQEFWDQKCITEVPSNNNNILWIKVKNEKLKTDKTGIFL